MKGYLKGAASNYSAACTKAYSSVTTFAQTHATKLLLCAGVVLLSAGLATASHAVEDSFINASFDDSQIRNAVGNLFALIEGAFGALIMVVAGLGAIVAAAMGAYRTAVGALVVAVGAFILRSLVSLFFGTSFKDSNAAGV